VELLALHNASSLQTVVILQYYPTLLANTMRVSFLTT